MLSIYNATGIDYKAIHSGSTKPCLMTLEDASNNIKGEYVVKIFKPNNIEQTASTSKEVFGSVLAQAFDLSTPPPVLVNVDSQLIKKLNQNEKYKDSNLVTGTYFATEYIESVTDYNPSALLWLETWEIENIFAFDVLIRNIDRHTRKPNLFFRQETIYLIDHELSLNTHYLDTNFSTMLANRQKYWRFVEIKKPNGFEKKHLFLDVLWELNYFSDVNFDTFNEYLRTLNVNILDSYNHQLENLGIFMNDYFLIKKYLIEAKNNADAFIQLLKDLIK